jgi:hypothetical protein
VSYDDEGEDPGEAPDTELMADLLRERYPIAKSDKLTITARTSPLLGLSLVLESGRERFEIVIEYLRDAGTRDRWSLLADALDALYGSFLESGRAYRDLPRGDDVEFGGAYFRVDATRTVPELVQAADRILEADAKKRSNGAGDLH